MKVSLYVVGVVGEDIAINLVDVDAYFKFDYPFVGSNFYLPSIGDKITDCIQIKGIKLNGTITNRVFKNYFREVDLYIELDDYSLEEFCDIEMSEDVLLLEYFQSKLVKSKVINGHDK